MPEQPEMSRQEFSVAYDGAGLRAHAIDVQTLAPALLAFGKLIREANAEFNKGRKATAKVLVVSDFEHKCFNINFEVIVSYLEQIKSLLGSEPIKSAKQVLELLGLIGLPASKKGVLTFLEYLKWKSGRKVSETKPLEDKDQTGLVQIHVEGDGNAITINQTVLRLSENAKALRATRDAFLPLGQDGFDRVRISADGEAVEQVDAESVKAIVASCNVGLDEAKEKDAEPEVEITPAWLSVYSPVYDVKASLWRFRLGTDVIYADISETNIAAETLARGGVAVEDAYQVNLEITTTTDASGKKKDPSYKILEVIRFVPAGPVMRQPSLFDGTD